MRTGKASGNRGDVDLLPCRLLVEASTPEPTEKRSTGATRERNPTLGLDLSRSLTNQHRARIPRL
jgi:hypothetical protein